jgi:hypothetical protein
MAAGLLLALAACGDAGTKPAETTGATAADGLVGLESAMSDASVTDVSTVEPAARPPGDEAAALVDPLASVYPEAPVETQPAGDERLEEQQKEGEAK